MAGKDDALARVRPLLERAGDWRQFLAEGLDVDEVVLFRWHERMGRPMGETKFLEQIEKTLGGPVVQAARRGINEMTSPLYDIMVPPDGSECDAVAGVVWSTPMWYTIGAISRVAVCAGLTEGRIEW